MQSPVIGFAIGTPKELKSPLVHRGGGQRRELNRVRDAAEAFVIGEEEQLVLLDRTAERAAELILIERQAAAADGLKNPDALNSVLRRNSHTSPWN